MRLLFRIGLAMIIAGAATGVFLSLGGAYDAGEARKYARDAKAFCNQTTGSPEIYQAMVVGEHGGIHCSAPHEGPHLHAYPREALRDAYLAEQRGESFDVDEYETDPAEFIYGDFWLVMGTVAGAAVVVGVVARAGNT